jgi:hypothetical protein
VRTGTNWHRQAILRANDGANGDRFGRAVAISGDTAVIGTELPDAAYVFIRQENIWVQQAKLLAEVPDTGLGSCVAIEGDTIVAGRRFDPSTRSNGGAAWVFQRTGTDWMQTARLTASDQDRITKFGISVAISGNQILVGAAGDSLASTGGSARLFEYDGTSWTEQAILKPDFPMADDGFGTAVSLADGIALVGHPRDDGNAGSAYLFPLNPRPAVNIHRIDPTASEPGVDTGQFKVTRFGNTDAALKVFYEVKGTATPGIDYVPLRGFATIAAGETTALFKVKPINDNDSEGAEDVFVTLLPDPAYDVVQPFQASITMAADDTTQ